MKRKYQIFLMILPVALVASVILPTAFSTSNTKTQDNSSISNVLNNAASFNDKTSNIHNQEFVEPNNSTNYAVNNTYWKSNYRFDAAIFANLWVDGMIPYQIKITQLQAFAQSNTPNLLENPPPNPTYTIDPKTLIVNNQTGEIQFDLSLDFYMFNGSIINLPFPKKNTIVLYNFNQVIASSLEVIPNNVINNFYPSTFADRLTQLESNQTNLFAFMNNYFNIGSFPSTTKIKFRNFANNATGQLNVNMVVDKYFSNDSYFTYIENPYSYSVTLDFKNQGLTTFDSYTIDISNDPTLNAYSMEQFLDELVQPGNNLSNTVKNQVSNKIYNLLKNKNFAITSNQLDLVVFDQNKVNYEIQSNLGILTLSTTLKDLIVTNDDVLKEKQFNKNTSEKIYVVGFDAVVDTIVQEDPNAPILTLTELRKRLDVNGGYYDPNNATVREFIQVISPQNTAPNLRIQFLNCTQPDPNVLKAEAIFHFSNGYINGQPSSFTQTFSFNILPSIYSTELAKSVTINSDQANFFPSDIFQNPSNNEIYKTLLRLNAFSNLPLDGITNDNVRFNWISYNNSNGEITIEVFLNKYLENSITVESIGFKNFGQIVIQGYNFTSATTATINPNYPKNIQPNKLKKYIDDYMLSENKSLTETMKLFFKFANTPILPQPFVVKSYSITDVNNDLGTAKIVIVCDNVFAGVDSRLSNNITFSSEFLLLESIDPTSIKTRIFLTGFSNMLASEFVSGFNDAPSTDYRVVALKNTILNQSYIINPPDNVQITDIKILAFDSDLNKHFSISVTLDSYYDENGDLQNSSITFPIHSYDDEILVIGDFRDVNDTKFVENSYLVEGKRNDLASTFSESDIRDFIVTNADRLGMITGDRPLNFRVFDSLVIDNNSIMYDDAKGTITLDVSLTYAYLNQGIINKPYTPYTTITLTGFYANVPTIFPDTIPATVNQGLPSSIWNKTAPEIAKPWHDYIVNDVLTGSVDGIVVTNPNDIVQSVNDKTGEISFEYTINGYWKSDVDPNNPAIWDPTPQTKKLIVTGLQTQTSTSFSRSTITPNNASAFVASDWKNNNFANANQQQQFLKNQNLLSAIVPGFDYLFNNSDTDIVVDNVTGTISLTVFVSHYYDDTSALLSNYDLATNSASFVKDNNHSLPITQTPANPNALSQIITISGFRTIISTGYIADSTIEYTGAGNLTNSNAGQIHAVLTNNQDPNYDNYNGFIEDFLWDNVVTGTKIGQNNQNTIRDNMSIISSSPNNLTGTISIQISLTHYWDIDGTWINGTLPLLKVIELSGFFEMQPTTFSSTNTIQVTGNLTTVTASDVRDALSNTSTSTIKQSITSLLFNNDIGGTKQPYLSSTNINANSFVVTGVDDKNGTITLTYSLDRYIDINGMERTGVLNRNVNLELTGFRTIIATSIISDINLNLFYKNENGEFFDVRNTLATDFINEPNFETDVVNLLTINRSFYVRTPPLGIWDAKEDFLGIVKSEIEVTNNGETGIRVEFRMKDIYVDNADGTVTIGIGILRTLLTGFKQPSSGPTTLQTGFWRDLADIPEVAFRTYIYASPINGLRQNFINQLSGNNQQTASDNLKKFIFNQWVNLNSNIGDGISNRITYEDIGFDVVNQSIGSSLSIEIWLAKYYNNENNGVFIDNSSLNVNEQKRLANENSLFRKVDIRGFVDPTSNRGPTIVSNVNRFDISSFQDPITGVADSSLVNLLPSAAINSQNDRALRLWILEKIYSGNKEGFATDYQNVNITSSFPDDRNGELRISVQLNKYWGQPIGNPPSSPIAYNGLSHTFTIVFQKQLLPTTINTPNNLTVNVPTNDPKYANIVNDIKSKTPQVFRTEYTDPAKWNDFLDYVKDWLVLNKNTAFSNLPEDLKNDDNLLRDAISMVYIRNSDVDASIYLNVNLSQYIDSDGQLIQNGNYRVSVQFTGFNRNNQPTYPLDARIDISQNPTNVNGIEHVYIPELAVLDATKSTFDQQMPFAKFLSLIMPIIQKYCITGRTDGLLESNNINLTSYQQVQFISTFGSLIIRFNFNQIYNSSGQTISGANNPVTLTLFGFVRKPPTLQSTDSLIPFVLGGIGAAILIIFIIIAFVIYYKKRKDVEYQQ